MCPDIPAGQFAVDICIALYQTYQTNLRSEWADAMQGGNILVNGLNGLKRPEMQRKFFPLLGGVRGVWG